MASQISKWLIPFALISSSAYANNFDYNYFEFRVGSSPQSMGAEYSVSLTDNFHALARLDSQFEHDGDAAGGIGFNGPLNDFVDIYGQALGHYVDYPNDENKSSETLLELNVGLRLWIAEKLETEIKVGTIDDHSIFNAGIRFHSTDQLSLGAGFVNNGIWGPQIEMNVRALF
ncbi:hypothetical protein OAP63_01825 [Vibrio sp.]|uniref:Outer membrane protein beta-barrel domain-containing protein n=1 Tax=Vibrio viridaestus TaxID=2487322 RepID=A0A3N9TKY4_9VIBR|nr:hypothetical protein [Vibrio viridaestus]MDC0609448.1 hypothetical protein [Vibrio sp.]RQW64781.1 hypothetical protein EES38_01670 [Vibrio viridaestus]